MRRKKLITGVIGGAFVIAALTVAGTYWVRTARKDRPIRVPESLPSNVHQQVSGYTFTRSEGGRQIFTVHAARTVAFKQGGTTVLEDVLVEVFGRSGNRHDILRTRRCDYNPQSGDLSSEGPVEIELNSQATVVPGADLQGKQPIHLETSNVAFERQGSLVVTDAPVNFRVGPATGTARGMEYATREGWLELKRDVRAEFVPGGKAPQPPVDLSASRLRYDKASAQVLLWGPIEIKQGMRRAVADHATVSLNAANRITRVDLEGAVRATDASEGRDTEISAQRAWGEFEPGSGEIRRLVVAGDVVGDSKGRGTESHLVASQLELNFRGAHVTPVDGSVSGNVQLTMFSPLTLGEGNGTRRQERKILTASQVKLAFRPDGQSVREMETVGPGKLVMFPADPSQGQRVITAGQFLMALDTRGRLENLRGLAPTRIVFEPPPHAPAPTMPRISSAERLVATFDPATQTLREVEQTGDYHFQEGDREASAQKGKYVADAQTLTLTGQPQVWDPESRLRCELLKLDLRTGTAEGAGKVQGTHLRGGDQAKAGAPVDPTNVLADRVVAHRRSQLIHYEGHVRAWHGADVLESSSLDVYRTERRISSGLQVLTAFLQPAPLVGKTPAEAASEPKETRPVTIRADRLEFYDQGRKASYRGHVRLVTEDTTLEADRMDVYFSVTGAAENSEVERAVADGNVKVFEPGREATGEHAEYFAGPGKIVLSGGRPTLNDVERGFTTGRSLTFFIHDDRLIVDGGGDSRSLSRHRVAQ